MPKSGKGELARGLGRLDQWQRPNNSFKPNARRNLVSFFNGAARVGLIQALGGMETVRLVMVDAVPQPGTPAFAEYGGATINVYTTELAEQPALALAKREVTDAGWQLQAIDETYLLTRADLADATPEGVGYFEQALLDGVVVVIHTYAATPQEGDLVH